MQSGDADMHTAIVHFSRSETRRRFRQPELPDRVLPAVLALGFKHRRRAVMNRCNQHFTGQEKSSCQCFN